MFRNILLATDGSLGSLNAARTAGEFVRLVPGAEVTVLHVMHVPPLIPEIAPVDVPLDVMIRRTAEPIINATLNALNLPEVQVHTEVQIGDPATEIVEMARTMPMDLIVMGTRGMSSLKGMLVGSVSNRVLHTASCPVLLVR